MMRFGRSSASGLAAVGIFLFSAPSASGAHPAEAGAPDRVPETVASALGGEVSVTSRGLYKVETRSGFSVRTHGPDFAAGLDDPLASALQPGDPERPPVCANQVPSSRYQQFVYAFPLSRPGGLEAARGQIQAAARRMNWLLDSASIASGGPHADYIVGCEAGGDVLVVSFLVSSASGHADYAEIVDAARDSGFADERVDYTIFYDGPAAGGGGLGRGPCGIANFSADERALADNLNNNPAGGDPGYAVVYEGCWNGLTPMHENGHNQGAVQYNAPFSTGDGAHCNQEPDVMCYSPDGGDINQGGTILCDPEPGVLHYDCGWDTYFDAAPEPGEWLFNHWNIGSLLNRFVHFTPFADSGAISGVIREFDSGVGMEGLTVQAAGPREVTTTTGRNGRYTLPHLPAGSYELTFEHFGYRSRALDVDVAAGQTARRSARLRPLPRHTVTGTVIGPDGASVEVARIGVEPTPFAPEVTADGAPWAFENVPNGSYTFTVTAYGGCLGTREFTRTVNGPESFVFKVPAATDAYGHRCRTKPVSWEEGSAPVVFDQPVNGLATLPLPFTFTHYGVGYDTIHLSTAGFASFTAPTRYFQDTNVPNANAPNGALYALWRSDCWYGGIGGPCPDPESVVRTATLGEAPSRRFVIEYLYRIGEVSFDLELILNEAGPGSVLYQYRGLDIEGRSGTVGIENADGTDGLEWARRLSIFERPESAAVLFRGPAGGVPF